MKTLAEKVMRLWRITAASLMLAVTLITLAQVIARYVFNSSLVWSEELNRLTFVWLILISAAGADHMRIGLLADKDRFKSLAKWFGLIAGISALGLIVWGASKLQTMFAFDRYVTLDISKFWYFCAALIGGSIWGISLIYQSFAKSDSKQDTAP